MNSNNISNSKSQADQNSKKSNPKTKNGAVRKRHEKTRELVQSKGFVTIDYLAKEFGVTPQTIRRDINMLSENGMITRYHGGAGLASSTENVEYNQRKIMNLKEKKQIAKIVAEKIPNKASLFINIGTTTEEIAKRLLNHEGLRVITNNLNVASIMSRKAGLSIDAALNNMLRQSG